ncbi:MAG: hypothetical protein RIK87_12525, partial [Fuerstiella sp.]
VVEHNTDVMVNSDWLIDIGPDSGAGGGTVVVAGSPVQVAQCAHSATGQYLHSVIGEAVLRMLTDSRCGRKLR